ncbi:hypothetical protein BU16DRAFT_569050 [Lophium mytilinum]|uniref:Aminodeoxychorismate lyase n=1 Tax=Lophium mytilinum TaxID=390894 RepID=A0A6A6RHC3_9PEZI|nr:hypothetical protein BU16DRAFT_569050 [Lophium mytilinum]
MATSSPPFELFTSLRYDPSLLQSAENSSSDFSFSSPSPFYMLVYHRDRMLEAAQHFEWSDVAKKLEDGPALADTLLEKVVEYQKRTGTEGPLKIRILFSITAALSVELSPVPAVPLSTLYPPSFTPPTPPSPPHLANAFKPSPLTGGALTLGPTDSLAASTPRDLQPPTWTLKLDPLPTSITPFTSLKTTERTHYDSSRTRALPPPAHSSQPALVEVMLRNPCDELTEGSMTSLYLFRGGRWVTPPVGVPAGRYAEEVKPGDGSLPGKDEGELRTPFPGRWGHSVRSAKVGSGGQRGTTRRWALGKGLCMEEPVLAETVQVGEGVWVSNGVRGFGFGRVVE